MFSTRIRFKNVSKHVGTSAINNGFGRHVILIASTLFDGKYGRKKESKAEEEIISRRQTNNTIGKLKCIKLYNITMSTTRATVMRSTSFKCTNCGKEFASEELFLSHKEM